MASELKLVTILFLCIYTHSFGTCHDSGNYSFGWNSGILQVGEQSVDSTLPNLNIIRKRRDANIYFEPIGNIKAFYNDPEFNDIEIIQKTTVSPSKNETLSLDVTSTTVPVFDICRDLQEKLGRSTSYFTQCAILKARPITLCLDCVVPYNETLHIYEKIVQVNSQGASCGDKFLHKDRLQVIQVLYVNAWNLWDQAHCNSCYSQQDGTTGKSNLSLFSDMTSTFMEALHEVTECFNNVSVNFSVHDRDVNSTCVRCDLVYRNLSSIYKSIVMNQNSDIYPTGVCMDITDAMNITRQRWNNEFKCKHFGLRFGYPVILLTVSVGIVPFLFYMAAKILGSVEDIKLILPKRKSFVQDSGILKN